MTNTLDLDDLLQFDAENNRAAGVDALNVWRIMIVDDDKDVHAATVFALTKVLILGRRLQFLHAYSGLEARDMLRRESNIAVILLDVVMESEDSGLNLVHYIRDELKDSDVRIILRTGQPGYAPEIEAIRDYDINDYKTKAELTRSKLFTTLTAATRSYAQIQTMSANRRGLDLIVRSSAQLIALDSLKEFASRVLIQLASLLSRPPVGLVFLQEGEEAASPSSYRALAAVGMPFDCINKELQALADLPLKAALIDTLQRAKGSFGVQGLSLYLGSVSGRSMLFYFETQQPLVATEKALVDVFSSNIAVCLNNIVLLDRLHRQAYFDSLLQMPNRMHFIEYLDTLITKNNHDSHIVVIADIDNFAEINDALGHHYGDALLKSVGRRLQTSFGEDIMLARIAGDAFALCGPEHLLAPSILAPLFLQAFDVKGAQQILTATLGFVRLTEVDGTGVDALKAANIALKQAKQGVKGLHAFYTREMGIDIRDRVKLLDELRLAFAAGRLFLNYQPQLRFSDRRVIGFEALLRWKSEDNRFIPPDHFIPIAEHSGLIIAMGEWVMHTACLQQKFLLGLGYPDIRMAINVSVVQFRHPGFLAMIDRVLADTAVDPSWIELEITESVAMLDANYMIEMIDCLKKRGLQVAVDDFGTGFSSLSYLQRFNVDRLKIDRSFVLQMNTSVDSTSIAGMVIDLGKHLGLSVIAEGVEDEEQARRLIELGCHEAQGYLYGRPMDASVLPEWLAKQLVR